MRWICPAAPGLNTIERPLVWGATEQEGNLSLPRQRSLTLLLTFLKPNLR